MDKHNEAPTCPVCGSPLDPQENACSVCGFKLLGATQSFRPVALIHDESANEGVASPTVAVLKIIRGPQTGILFTLEKDAYTIGRSPQCDIFLNDMTVSRNHALIKRTGSTYEISDSNSFNGVWINGESVEKKILHEGDMIQIGVFCFRYQENQ